MATARYREQEDVLAPIIEDRCVVGSELTVSRKGIWLAYQEWADGGREQGRLDRNGLYERLRARGFEEVWVEEHAKKQRGFMGIGLAVH